MPGEIKMHLYFDLFGREVPSYGLMIVIGVITANMIALVMIRYKKLDVYDFIILEAYCFLGAFIGAKMLYLIVSYDEIDWSRLGQIDYFNQLMQGGFVFYGGLIGGLLFVYMAGRIHKIESKEYINNFIFLIPYIHGFGRIGCFCVGCCYGLPYSGIGAVKFPGNSFAPSNVSLFPIQLVEALFLFVIAFTDGYLLIRKEWKYTVETYLLSYGVLRFVLEYFRYDEARGYFMGITTSQWISIFIIIICLYVVFKKYRSVSWSTRSQQEKI